MRVLRFVGPGADSSHVTVETTDGGEQFSLHVSDHLRSAIQSDLPRFPTSFSGPATPAPPAIAPREIQMRVRAGESPESIADQADASLDRIMRFAGPVLEERARVTVEARRARARQSTAEGQLVPFGESVDARFAAHGIEPTAVVWDSYRRDDGAWVISAGWHGGDADRIARWALALTTRTVTPLDETAADLLSDRPIRPIVHAVPDDPGAVADTLTGPLPTPQALDDFFDQEAGQRAAARRDAPTLFDKNQPAAEVPAPEGGDEPSSEQADQALPLRIADPVENRSHGRTKVPAWDDIMLGVRRKTD